MLYIPLCVMSFSGRCFYFNHILIANNFATSMEMAVQLQTLRLLKLIFFWKCLVKESPYLKNIFVTVWIPKFISCSLIL
jgi:hypothetical protein